MRLVVRHGPGERRPLGTLVVAAAILLTLAGLGIAITVAVRNSGLHVQAVRSKDGSYADLPSMTFTLGGVSTHAIDLKVRLVFDPGVDPKVTDAYLPRLSDRLYERVSEYTPEQLAGADGALLMKRTITGVVERELKPLRVRDVLLEQMVIH